MQRTSHRTVGPRRLGLLACVFLGPSVWPVRSSDPDRLTPEAPPSHRQLAAARGVNHVVTDGLDELTINSHDTVELAVVYPRARNARVNWGDGSVDSARVDLATGLVAASHTYNLTSAGKMDITIATTEATGATSTHAVAATVTHLLLDQAPGMLSLTRRPGNGVHLSFAGLPGDTYTIEATWDLAHPDGHAVANRICDLDGTVRVDVPPWEAHPARFFRAVAAMELLQ